jgi:deoxycytidylate deaminase
MNFDKIIEVSYALINKHNADLRCRHFSFILDKTKIISIGLNSLKTHPLNLKYNYVNKNKEKISDIVGTHSELSAVIKLGEEDCSGLTLVNTRINRNDELDFSAPCNGCSDMVRQLNFKQVWYSNANGLFNKLNLTSIIN